MTVANSREERGKAIAQIAGMSHASLMRELEGWTITADKIRDDARDLRARRGESRTMLELIAAELRSRHGTKAPAVVDAQAEAVA